MRLTETQFEILKLCYENKDEDVVFSNKDFAQSIPSSNYRDSAFLKKEGCLVEFGSQCQPVYIIDKRGEEVYLENLDRKNAQQMQKKNHKIAVWTLICGIASTIASIVAAFFAFYFR